MAKTKRSHKKSHKQSDTFEKIVQRRNRAFKRYPILLTLLGTFGVVSTFYGAQHLLDRVPLLANNPIISFAFGILLLLFTGTLYKRLG